MVCQLLTHNGHFKVVCCVVRVAVDRDIQGSAPKRKTWMAGTGPAIAIYSG